MNHLSGEQSPYLLQHAGNPVDWYPWGTEAFEKARREQKPVLLSVGYSTCHWCHVMAHESFENEEIAALLNERFVAVKVDREERPDLDHIYMGAVTAMTGQGGWPLTAFLTPEAKPFYGGTYFPPYPKWNVPGFKDLLLSISQAWEKDRKDILDSSEGITAALQGAMAGHGQAVPGALSDDVLHSAFTRLASQFDPTHGGFGHAPKFPMGHSLSFLLRFHQNTGDARALDMVRQTLAAMARGGIYDHLGGGFHRYSTDRQWQVPHFEKMLYDQALLVLAYAEMYQVSGDAVHARTATEVLDYVLRDMASPEGGFFSAEDADSEGHEGTFYVWTKEGITAVLGEEQAKIFERYYGFKEFEGKDILFLTQDIPVGDQNLMDGARRKLFLHRCSRPRPHLDDKVLTDWNGLMIAAFAFAGAVLGDQRYIDAARRAADFILTRMKQGDGLLHSWRGAQGRINGMLEDYAFFSFGLLHVYEATFEERYLTQAAALADRMLASFADPAGGFFMAASGAADLIVRPQEVYDGALPSGNSVAGHVLVKLHYLTGRREYMEQAKRLFERFIPAVSRNPQAYTFFLAALDLYLKAPVEITVRGAPDESAIANIRKVVYKHFIPRKVFQQQAGDKAWSVGVCRDRVCLPETTDLSMIEDTVR